MGLVPIAFTAGWWITKSPKLDNDREERSTSPPAPHTPSEEDRTRGYRPGENRPRTGPGLRTPHPVIAHRTRARPHPQRTTTASYIVAVVHCRPTSHSTLVTAVREVTRAVTTTPRCEPRTRPGRSPRLAGLGSNPCPVVEVRKSAVLPGTRLVRGFLD